MQYAWLVWSSILLVIWGIIYFSLKNRESRKEMLTVSFWTMLLALTEPIFVPRYWNPPSLFDLVAKTGFDLESFIFAFAIGGIAVSIYEKIFPVQHEKIATDDTMAGRYKYHRLALLVAPLVFALLILFINLNPIYSVVISLVVSGLIAIFCRPDLKNKMLVSALVFALLYFGYFLTLIALYPGYVERVWNLQALSGILILGVPLEEILFALAVGFFWSSVYEYFTGRRLKLNRP